MLDNSAAKHKMAVRPQRKRPSESRPTSLLLKDGDTTESGSDVESSKKVKSEQEQGPQPYRRTRSGGRQGASADPKSKRE